MVIHLLDVPYSLGREATGSGLGPGRLLDAGLPEILQQSGHLTRLVHVRRSEDFRHEIGAAFDVSRTLAGCVGEAIACAAFPLVLAGDCNACLGILAGMGTGRTGIVWFDSHGDFNTPETTVTGFLGGMPLAAAVGRCWTALCATLPGFRAVTESRVVLCDARALDPREEEELRASAVRVVDGRRVGRLGIHEALRHPVEALAAQVDNIYVHVDLDVLDPQQVRANIYAERGGLTVEDVIAGVQAVAKRIPIRAAALTAYDPAYDESGRAAAAGLRIVSALADAVGATRR